MWRLPILVLSCALVAMAGDVPRPAPPLTLAKPGGGQVSLEDYRGKVLLLKFFLTDCPHCQRSAGHIMPVYRDWRGRGFEVLGVAINPDAAQRLPDFIQRFGVTYPMALGSSNTVKSFADISAVKQFFVPYMFLIDRQGTIRYEHPGGDRAFYDNEAVNLRTEVDTLLKQPVQARKAVKTVKKAPAPKS